jgi:hypothetical protein
MSECKVNVVNVVGGLGNQLFQYLFGSYLEEMTSTKTYYDIRDYSNYKKHGGFSLASIFESPAPLMKLAENSHIPLAGRYTVIKRLINRVPFSSNFFPDIVSDSGFVDLARLEVYKNKKKYYIGCWQSIQYTDSQIAKFLAKNSLKSDILKSLVDYGNECGIDFVTSAAVHVRLGDYLKSDHSWHLPLNEQYYRNIMVELLNNGSVEHFYVFSDFIKDIESSWFHGLPVTFMANYGGQTAATDMVFISCFQNIVISASTFGWWAATFAPFATVYAPWPWVRPKFESQARYSTNIPNTWHKRDSLGYDLVLTACS